MNAIISYLNLGGVHHNQQGRPVHCPVALLLRSMTFLLCFSGDCMLGQ